MSDVSGVSSGNSQLDLLVESYKQSQASRVSNLKTRKTDLQSKQNFYNNLNSKLSSLTSSLDKFGNFKKIGDKWEYSKLDGIDEDFVTRSISSSDSSVLTATVNSAATVGVHSAKVNRLASNDLLVSKKLNLTESFGMAAGTYKFKLTSGDTSKEVSVALLGNETNQQALKKITEAINNTTDITVNSSFVKDTETTGRLSLSAEETGQANQVVVEETELTQKLGWTASLNADTANRTIFTATDAGYRTKDVADLTSKFELDGIAITRDSNEISDALDGITFNLLKVQDAEDAAVSLTTAIDSKAVEDLINPLVKSYNEMMTFLNSSRSLMRSDSGVTSLQSRLRSLLTTQLVPGTDTDTPHYLTDIGFKINQDGTLTLSDKDKLKTYLAKANGSQKVSDLFTSENGFVSKINDAVASLRSNSDSSGLIQTRKKSIDEQIRNTDKRITQVQDSIDQQAEILKKEYENYLKSFYTAQGQYSIIGTMSSGSSTSGYSSLMSGSY